MTPAAPGHLETGRSPPLYHAQCLHYGSSAIMEVIYSKTPASLQQMVRLVSDIESAFRHEAQAMPEGVFRGRPAGPGRRDAFAISGPVRQPFMLGCTGVHRCESVLVSWRLKHSLLVGDAGPSRRAHTRIR